MAKISRGDVIAMLAEHKLFASTAPEPGGDSPVAWDSLSLTWFLTKVEQRYGLEIDPADVDPEALCSVDRILAFLEAMTGPQR